VMVQGSIIIFGAEQVLWSKTFGWQWWNELLRIILGPKREKVTGETGENCVMRSFVIYTLHYILLE